MSNSDINSLPPEVFSRTLAHAQSSYANAQDIIKFLDHKAGVITGLITIVTALPMLAFQWIAERDSPSTFSLSTMLSISPLRVELCGWLCLAGLFAGGLGLLTALAALRARAVSGVPTFLFPFCGPNCEFAAAHFARLSSGLTEAEVLNDYRTQLQRVGGILHEKVRHLSTALLLFQIEVAFFVAALGIVLWAIKAP